MKLTRYLIAREGDDPDDPGLPDIPTTPDLPDIPTTPDLPTLPSTPAPGSDE